MCTAYIVSIASLSLKICICLYPKPPEGKYIYVCLAVNICLQLILKEILSHVHKSSTEQFFVVFVMPDINQSTPKDEGTLEVHLLDYFGGGGVALVRTAHLRKHNKDKMQK